MIMNSTEKNNLAHWFPTLEVSGVLVPRTVIVHAGEPIIQAAYGEPAPALDPLVEKLIEAAKGFGFPVFLRTGHGSGKHEWKDTCFVASAGNMHAHVMGLLEWSEMVDMMGLPTETWVVREFLSLATTFHAFYGGMPINKERRYFFENGKVVCQHPYWPEVSIQDPDCEDWAAKLAELNAESPEEIAFLTAETERVAAAFLQVHDLDGAWSLDWAYAADGRWYAIDMAVAGRSFHWDGCPQAVRFLGKPKTPREMAIEMLSGGSRE